MFLFKVVATSRYPLIHTNLLLPPSPQKKPIIFSFIFHLSFFLFRFHPSQMILANKMDCPNADENLRKLRRKTRLPILPISALHKGGVEDAVFFMRSLANEELEVRRKQEERQRYLQLVADQNALSDQNNRK
eukprot:TRINITY_DN3717_c0_g1_i4.p1 TRINITY_DN3717_c0_g1~~TRINITY_DN3717_c0_g1_i4.p1  ORF type:complete len:132 (-),score=20.78 TRINITY_DN3717_c0_g1_i4:25-420(-)